MAPSTEPWRDRERFQSAQKSSDRGGGRRRRDSRAEPPGWPLWKEGQVVSSPLRGGRAGQGRAGQGSPHTARSPPAPSWARLLGKALQEGGGRPVPPADPRAPEEPPSCHPGGGSQDPGYIHSVLLHPDRPFGTRGVAEKTQRRGLPGAEGGAPWLQWEESNEALHRGPHALPDPQRVA